MSDERRFNSEETARILQRAVELRPSLPERLQAMSRDGVSLAQLQEAAAEAGMDVEAVRLAAAELDAPPALRTSPWYGSPTRLVEERVIRRTVRPEEFDGFVDEVRRVLGMVGVVSVTARGVTWSSLPPGAAAPQGQRLFISLVSRTDGTSLRVEEDLTPDTAGFFGGAIGFGILGALIAGSALAGIAPVLALAAPIVPGAAWAGARALMRRTYDARRREAARLATQLAARCEEPFA